MAYGIRLTAIMAVPVLVLIIAGGAEAGNRKAFKSLVAQAENFCAEIKKNEVYECSVEKCPCKDGLREVKRFDKLRTRPACVCTPETGRANVNQANATDFCVHWNHRKAKDGDRCFVVAGSSCPAGTSELENFNRLRGRGPEQTACRGEPPEDEEDEEEVEEEKADEGQQPDEVSGD